MSDERMRVYQRIVDDGQPLAHFACVEVLNEIDSLRAANTLLKSERNAVSSPCPSCTGDAGYESGGPEGWIADECTCHPLRQENERLKADLQIAEFERDDAMAKCAVYREAMKNRPIGEFRALLADPDPAAQALLRDRDILDWADSHRGVYASRDDSDPREGDLTFREMLNFIKQDAEENPNA